MHVHDEEMMKRNGVRALCAEPFSTKLSLNTRGDVKVDEKTGLRAERNGDFFDTFSLINFDSTQLDGDGSLFLLLQASFSRDGLLGHATGVWGREWVAF